LSSIAVSIEIWREGKLEAGSRAGVGQGERYQYKR